MSTGEATPTGDVSVVVLAGGTSRRFGSDKLAAPLGASTVLDHLIGSLPAAWPVVVVGPRRAGTRPVTWTREDPPGGGPLAGVAAGVALVRTDLVAVVAGDMPFAGAALERIVGALRTSPPQVCGVVARDGAQEVNPLLAAYRTEAVRSVLPDQPGGRPARALLALPHVELAMDGPAVRGVDTPADLERLTDPR